MEQPHYVFVQTHNHLHSYLLNAKMRDCTTVLSTTGKMR